MWKIESILARVFLILTAVLLCLISLEGLTRIFKKSITASTFRDINDHTYFPRPFVMSSAKPGLLDHNELGYRGKLPPMPKAEKEFRIFFFGGSVVYNDTKEDSSELFKHTLPEKLQKLFFQHGMNNVKVYSFGAVSSNSRQDLIRLILDASGYQPDLCIFYSGYNDLNISSEFRPNYPHRHILFDLNPALRLNASDTPVLAYVALSSEFLRTFFPGLVERAVFTDQISKMKSRYYSFLSPEENDRLRVDAYIQNLLTARIFTQSIGSEFLPILQPILSMKRNPSEEERLLAREPKFNELFINILRAAERKNVSITDFSDIFGNDSRYLFKDSVHLTDKGNSLVAEKLFKLLSEKRFLSKRPSAGNPIRYQLLPEHRFHPPLSYYQD